MNKYVLNRLQAIQEQLEELKQIIAGEIEGTPPRKTQLKGLWEEAKVTDEELEEAGRELFRNACELEE